MFPYRDSRITQVVLGLFFLVVLAYAYYEARGILYGPDIVLSSAVTEVTEPFVLISGSAERIASLRMNGKLIAVTETGAFEEPYLLAPGLNRIVFDAEDRYGRSATEVLQLVYKVPEGAVQGPATSSLPTATTTSETHETASTTPISPTE